MKANKLTLKKLTVESFITTIDGKVIQTLKGGTGTSLFQPSQAGLNCMPRNSINTKGLAEASVQASCLGNICYEAHQSNANHECKVDSGTNPITGSGNANVCGDGGEVHSGLDGVGCAFSDYEINGACQ